MRKFLSLLSLLAVLPFIMGPIEPPDPYTIFLKSAWKTARHWRPNMPVDEFEKLAWSSWEGCAKEYLVERYFSICIRECGLDPVDNVDYFGYSGGRWYVIIVCLQRDGMKRPVHGWRTWIRENPFYVNKILAKQFARLSEKAFLSDDDEETAVRTWLVGPIWRKYPEVTENVRDLKARQLRGDRLNPREKTEIYLYEVQYILSYYYDRKSEVYELTSP